MTERPAVQLQEALKMRSKQPPEKGVLVAGAAAV